MHPGGPIVFITAAANDLLTLALYFLEKGCRCTRIGPLHLLLLLTIYSLEPIISSEGAADALGWAYCLFLLLLMIYLFGPIISSEVKCCRYTRVGHCIHCC